MDRDRTDLVLEDWSEERPELSTEALGIVLRIQFLEKILADQLAEALSKLDLEWFEYDVLSALRRQGVPFQMIASDIAEGSMLSPGALTNRIDRLIERKLVTRAEDPEDRRRVLVTLTKKGIKLVDRTTEARFMCAEEAVNHFSAAEKKQLNSLLRKFLLSADESSSD